MNQNQNQTATKMKSSEEGEWLGECLACLLGAVMWGHGNLVGDGAVERASSSARVGRANTTIEGERESELDGDEGCLFSHEKA